MTLPLYKYYQVPRLHQTWITSIFLDIKFMFLKILFSLVNLTTSGQIDLELEYTCQIHLTMLPAHPLYSTHKLGTCPLNFTESMMKHLSLANGMQSLNKFFYIYPNMWKKILNYLSPKFYQQNHLIPKMTLFYLMLQIHRQFFLLNGRPHNQKLRVFR